MKTRKEIEQVANKTFVSLFMEKLILEVVLDIRDLLSNQKDS